MDTINSYAYLISHAICRSIPNDWNCDYRPGYISSIPILSKQKYRSSNLELYLRAHFIIGVIQYLAVLPFSSCYCGCARDSVYHKLKLAIVLYTSTYGLLIVLLALGFAVLLLVGTITLQCWFGYIMMTSNIM